MSKLPLKVSLGIRESWESVDAPAQKAIQALKDDIGVRVRVDPEWPLLHEELGPFYAADKAPFAPSVAAAVETFCTALRTLADDEANADWADAMLERTDSNIRIFLEVSKSREIGLAWSDTQTGFVISLPRSIVPSPSHMLSFFSGSLLGVFEEGAKHAASLQTHDSVAAADDWADVVVEKGTGRASAVVVETPQRYAVASQPQQQQQQPQQPIIDVIPDVGTQSRPDDLLLKPPYHLIIHSTGRMSFEVQCSHSPTLQFLSDYLTKWSRTNHHNTTKPPVAEVKLHQSAFGLGVLYDRLTISSETRYSVQAVSPTIVLSLVEGVLGYQSVSSDGSSWTFRKDVEFKKSRY